MLRLNLVHEYEELEHSFVNNHNDEVVSQFVLPESRVNFVVLKNITSDSIKNSLALYGEYIYQRESCNNCHRLQDGLDLKRISLDGLGGKYSDAGHYYHLWEPESLVPESTMPAFTKLYSRKIDKEKFLEICKSKWGYFTMKKTQKK